MTYTVQQLATLAGVSVRTLHHYDHVGLLTPARIHHNDYRQYGEVELLKLQQILFFRELDFPIAVIKKILSSPNFSMEHALRGQRKLIELKKERLSGLITTIDKTIKKINNEITMDDKDLYGGLSKEKMEEYAKEAKERWGHTDAYKQSTERVAKMSKEEMIKIATDGATLMREIAAIMNTGPQSDEAQKLIARHYDGLRVFYDPNPKMYRGLAEMYVADVRFTAYYEKFAPGLAAFMRDAMIHFADNSEIQEKKS